MQKMAGGAGYHVCQSLIAVGTGGVAGRGYMEGVQKLFFLPEAHTDFIFANIAEEMGFIGAIAIVLLFAAFALRACASPSTCRTPLAASPLRHHRGRGSASLLQHQRGACPVAHQRHSPAADLLRRNLDCRDPGQHWNPAQHQQEGGLRCQREIAILYSSCLASLR